MDMDCNLLSDRIAHGHNTARRAVYVSDKADAHTLGTCGGGQGLPENWRDYFRDRLAKATREAM
jgi:hypothetical protein